MADKNQTSLRVLLSVAEARTAEYPMGEQIRIYQALADGLPNGPQKLRARELARVLSRADALQLEFRQTMKG